MKDYNKYLFDKNIEINLTANDNSMNYNDKTNITSINQNSKKSYNYNLLLPSYNPRQNKDEKSNSLINKFLNKKEDFFKEKNESNENKILKLNSKYSTCNNYYPRKNYNKFLNSHQQVNSSIINNINIFQQNTTFEGSGGYNKLNTRDLIEITKRRKEIIEQKKLRDEEKKKDIENNLNNLDIVINKNLNDSGGDLKNFCDEGVQTSLININEPVDDVNNKKEEPLSTIIFTDKSALINQEITFLSIQCSLKNNGENIEDSKEYKNTENDCVNLGYDIKESNNRNKNKEKIKLDNNKIEVNKNIIKINKSLKSNNDIEKINKSIKNNIKDSTNNSKNNLNNSIKNKKNKNGNVEKENNENLKENNDNDELAFTIVNNTQTTPEKKENEDDYYITNGAETFQIESNSNFKQPINNFEDNNNFTITNNNKEENVNLSDSLEDSNENNTLNKSKSLSNNDENELTEVEEFDQNLIFLQNESKTMTSHFNNMKNKNNEENEDINESNKDNILIEDDFKIKTNNSNNINNYSKTIDNNDIINDKNNNSLFDSKNIIEEKNMELFNDNKNKINYKENLFRSKGKKNNSLNKYNDYPTLKNINLNENNNNLKTKLFNNNYTNNNRYQNKVINLEDKDNECFDFLKLKTSDLKLNNQEEKIIIKPIQNFNDNNYKPNSSTSNGNNNFQNIKFFSHKKLNTNLNSNNNKNNINNIPIKPSKTKNSEIINNLHVNNPILKSNNNNYLITPRCVKKKRQLNNYAEYYKLKISMCNDSNNYTNNEISHNKNYRSIGHKKSNENLKNKD